MSIQRMRVSEKTLTAVSAASLIALTLELIWPHPLERAAATPEAATQPGVVAALDGDWPPAGQATVAIVERPLFTPDRRPYQPPKDEPTEAAPAAPPEPPVEFALSGIVTSADHRIALLKADNSSETIKLTMGEAHAGWTLTGVFADSVTLSKGRQSVTVPLQPEYDAAAPRARRRRER